MLRQGINIVSATNLRRNLTQYLEEIDREQGSVFITLNGEGTHVIMHIDAYNDLMRYKEYVLKNRIDIDKA